jgi:hypothetical protein
LSNDASAFLRHTLATLAYRGGKAVRDAPPFSSFRAGPGSRTAGEILAHIGDLLDWAVSLARGEQKWEPRAPQEWAADVKRFHEGLATLDEYLSSEAPLGSPAEKIFQGPIADALTHVGQIAMLRRLANAPVKGENYHRAEISIGRVGVDQPKAIREF